MSMEERAIRGVPLTLLAFATQKAVSVLSMLVLARLLAPADFGLMAIALTAVNFLNWFGGMSFSGAIVVHQDLDRARQGTVLTLVLGTSAMTAVLAAAAGLVLAAAFDEPRLRLMMVVLGVGILIQGFGAFYDLLLRRELQFRAWLVSVIAQTAVNAATAIALAAAGAGVWSLVAGQLAGVTAYAACMLLLAPHRLRLGWDRAVAGRMARTGAGFFSQGVTVFLRQNADTAAVAAAFGTRSLGFYSVAYRLGDLTYWAIVDPVAKVTFPGFARVRHRGEDVRPPFLGVFHLVALVACPAGVLLSACAAPLIATVFGAKWAPMEGVLAILGIWAAMRPLEATLSWLLNSVQHAGAVGWASLAILVPVVPGVVVAALLGTVSTVALVPLLDTLLALGLFAVLVRRYVDLPLARQWRAVRPVLLAAPPMWVAARLVADAVGGPPLVALLASIAAGLAAYAVALTAFEPGILPRAFRQIARTFGREAPARAA